MIPFPQSSFRVRSAASGQSISAMHALQTHPSVSNCSKHHHKHSWAASTSPQAVRASAASQQGFLTHREQLQSETGSSWVSGSQGSSGGVNRQRQPIWLQPLRLDEIWYLGYGSNMNPQVLTGRRRVRPQQSLPCYVPGYTLSFGVQGFPWAEPGFATIQPCRADSSCSAEAPGSNPSSWRRHVDAGSTPCLHAVLHRVTKKEWAAIKASEGVLSSDSSSIGYQVVEVDCVLYDDTTVVKAVTLQAAPASLHHTGRDVQPSARYLGLLQAGGRHHGLDSHYQQWLDSLQPYRPPSMLQASLGSLASGAVLLSAAYTAVPAYVLSKATGGSSTSNSEAGSEKQPAQQAAAAGDSAPSSSSSDSRPSPPGGFLPFLRWYTGSSQKLVWDVHDRLAPWLGSGSSMGRDV